MKKIAATLVLLSIFSTSVFCQVTRRDLREAEEMIPRNGLQPVKSLIPTSAPSCDTLDTSDQRIKIVLFSDNTWKYIFDGEIMASDSLYTEYWSHDRANSYSVQYQDLPIRTTLWLSDQQHNFCIPYQKAVYSKFGIRRGRPHMGVDLPCPTGEPMRSAFDGKVRFAARCGGYGNLVVIRHPNGLETYYGHLSKINVELDQWVSAGEVIGLGGSTGRSTGPHLHFETRYKGFAFDPQWIIDFENGNLRQGVYVLRRKLLSPGSTYVPESEDEEEQILLTEEQERAEEERIARELAAAKYHKIRSGDTLSGLAVKYGTTVSKICKLNGITTKTTLKVGRTIRVK